MRLGGLGRRLEPLPLQAEPSSECVKLRFAARVAEQVTPTVSVTSTRAPGLRIGWGWVRYQSVNVHGHDG